MTVPSPSLAAQVARLPFDGVCLDMQHGMIGFPDAVGMIAAINAAGRPAIVRSLWNDAATPGQCFDAGAACVIAPMVNTPGPGGGAGARRQVSAHGSAELGRLHGAAGDRAWRRSTICARPTA